MADLTIRLVIDPDTGKKNVMIDYHSDSDAMPMEHEDEHRQLVDKLIEGGALKAAELGKIIVKREEGQSETCEQPQEEAAQERESLAHDQ